MQVSHPVEALGHDARERTTTGRDRSPGATRRRIVELLRREPLTIRGVAARLALTASAVRLHMTALERQGIVRRSGVSRGLNRPAAIYEPAPGADAQRYGAYVPFVATLLDTLGESLSRDEVATLMRASGRRLAAGRARPEGTLRERAHAASTALNELGASSELAEPLDAAGGVTIEGLHCPLASAVLGSPAVCRALESFVAELVQAPVASRCDRAGRPRCRFEIGRVDGQVEIGRMVGRPESDRSGSEP